MSNGEVIEQLQPLKKFLPEAGSVTRPYGSEEKVLQQFEESPASASPVALQNCQHQKGFRTTSLERHQQSHAVVFVEDLQVKNMSASSKGTKAKPGKRVTRSPG